MGEANRRRRAQVEHWLESTGMIEFTPVADVERLDHISEVFAGFGEPPIAEEKTYNCNGGQVAEAGPVRGAELSVQNRTAEVLTRSSLLNALHITHLPKSLRHQS